MFVCVTKKRHSNLYGFQYTYSVALNAQWWLQLFILEDDVPGWCVYITHWSEVSMEKTFWILYLRFNGRLTARIELALIQWLGFLLASYKRLTIFISKLLFMHFSLDSLANPSKFSSYQHPPFVVLKFFVFRYFPCGIFASVIFTHFSKFPHGVRCG